MKDPKLVIQIPCYNEEETLPLALDDIPREIPGVSDVKILVIDDGSTDRTARVAREKGVDHILSLKEKKSLAEVFASGLEASLKLGADIIVNFDADNQYKGADIARLIEPVIENKADLVLGCRDIENIAHFSPLKKRLQRLGSGMVKFLSGIDIPDATTGFRAYSKETATKLNVLSEFTYTLETIIAAGNLGLTVKTIQVSTNPELRESRLFKSIPEYLKRSGATLIRIYTMYRPLKVFSIIGGLIFGAGFFLGLRFLYFFILNKGAAGHVQSLILSAVFLIIGFQIILLGMLSDLIAANRRLTESALSRIKEMELRD
ncbi:MAG: glycosyltransferase [Candidatus Omnitrophica bacterium]|nr:glycosyltransferase [Candidatus Omnitrophota bacterium]